MFFMYDFLREVRLESRDNIKLTRMRFMHSHIFALEGGSNMMKTFHPNNGAWVK